MRSTRKRKQFSKKSRKAKKMEKRLNCSKKMRRLKKSGRMIGGDNISINDLIKRYGDYEDINYYQTKKALVENLNNIITKLTNIFYSEVTGTPEIKQKVKIFIPRYRKCLNSLNKIILNMDERVDDNKIMDNINSAMTLFNQLYYELDILVKETLTFDEDKLFKLSKNVKYNSAVQDIRMELGSVLSKTSVICGKIDKILHEYYNYVHEYSPKLRQLRQNRWAAENREEMEAYL